MIQTDFSSHSSEILTALPLGLALHLLIREKSEGELQRLELLEYNSRFAGQSGLRMHQSDENRTGAMVPVFFPTEEECLDFYRQIRSDSEPLVKEVYCAAKDRWYQIQAFMLRTGLCSSTVVELSDSRRADKRFDEEKRLFQRDAQLQQRRLQNRMALEKMVSDISSSFVNAGLGSLDEKIEYMLEITGSFLGLDRGNLFTLNEGRMECRQEWCANGTSPGLSSQDALILEEVPWFYGRISRQIPLVIDSIDSIPAEAQKERLLFRQFHIESHLSIPLVIEGKLEGFFSFETTALRRKWDEDEISLLMLLGGTLSDALSRNRMELELIKSTKAAERANLAKSEFLARMSHEIRTPLNGVIGMSGLLLETHMSSEQRRFADIILTSGEALLAVINDILDYSKIEAGKMELEQMEFSLITVLEETADLLALKAQLKGLAFYYSVDPDVPQRLQGDPGRLRQILINLAGNALKFTDEGFISIRVQMAKGENGRVGLLFVVNDTGPGVPPEDRDLLFEEFHQADGSATRRHGGTGLGLAISRQLCEMMGGTIGVDAREGGGSSFHFTGQFESASGNLSADFPELKGRSILIVDALSGRSEAVSELLATAGAVVRQAAEGPSALNALFGDQGDEVFPFDLVLIDKEIPGMNALSLASALAADVRLKNIKLIYMPPIADLIHHHLKLQSPFHALIPRPVSPLTLQRQLARVLTGDRQVELPDGGGQSRGAGEQPRSDLNLLNEPSRPDLSVEKSPTVGRRILIVEDNLTNRQVALGMVRKMGCRADVAANGQEALDALMKIPYSLVLMDLQMPVMDGLEATRKIREMGQGSLNHGVTVIALTANALKQDRERCLKAGMNDFLSKPVTPAQLRELLHKWLPGPGDCKIKSEANEGHQEGAVIAFEGAALLERLSGDLDLSRKVVRGFLIDMQRQFPRLKRFLEQDEYEEAGRLAHTLKGAALSAGAVALSRHLIQVESALRDRKVPATLHDRLHYLLDQFESEAGLFLRMAVASEDNHEIIDRRR